MAHKLLQPALPLGLELAHTTTNKKQVLITYIEYHIHIIFVYDLYTHTLSDICLTTSSLVLSCSYPAITQLTFESSLSTRDHASPIAGLTVS